MCIAHRTLALSGSQNVNITFAKDLTTSARPLDLRGQGPNISERDTPRTSATHYQPRNPKTVIMRIANITFPLLAALATSDVFGQMQNREADFHVVNYDPASKTITVDAVSPDAEDLTALTIGQATQLVDRKGAPIGEDQLRPGTGFKAAWIEENFETKLLSVLVNEPYSAADVSLEGQLDAFDPSTGEAVIAGERVVLDPGVKVAGDDGIKGEFEGFGALTLGNLIDLKGVRDQNGVVRANKATVRPFKLTKGWKDVLKKLDEQLSTRYIVWAPGVVTVERGPGMFGNGSGYALFNNARQTLVNDADLQRYVNDVGHRVVPEWMINMPATAPQRVDFRFVVVDNENFSLHSAPNGMVFVSTGALAEIDSEDQLASVLAREVAHVLYRHSEKRQELMENLRAAVWAAIKAKKIADEGISVETTMYKPDPVLVDILTLLAFQGLQGDMKAAAQQSMTFLPMVVALPEKLQKDLLGLLFNLRGLTSPVFSTAAESEADRIALSYLYRAGYDPREAAQVWKPFVKLTLGDGMNVLKNSWEAYLAGPKPFEGPNQLKDAGNVLLGQVVLAAADNWFGDRARSRSRFASMNLCLQRSLGSADLSSRAPAKDAYAPYKAKAQALLVGGN